MSDEKPAVTLAELRDIALHLPPPDLEAGTAVTERDAQLTKPPGSLGRLEEIAHWVASWQGRATPRMRHARVAVFAGNHGIAAAHPVSAFPVEVTRQMIANYKAGGAGINQLAKLCDAELKVYELDIDHPTEDFSQGPAMTEEGCARAMAYGMMAVEPGIDIIALGEMGIGNTTSAAAMATALFGGPAADWVGRGSGISDKGLELKAGLIEQGLKANAASLGDPLQVLRCFGGFELAAITGAVLAARMGRVPVLLDGYTCTVAAAILHAIDPRALDHCMIAHLSVEPGHQRLLDRLGRDALLNMNMRLGEASGATLAINIVKAAVACHNDMATFAEAGVSAKEN